VEETRYLPVDAEDEIDIRELLRVLWRYRLMIVVVTLCASLAAGLMSKFVLSPVYKGSAMIEIKPIPLIADYFPMSSPATYANVVQSDAVLVNAARRLGMDGGNYTAGRLRERVKAEVPKDTQIITVTTEDNDPKRAAALANAVCEELRDVIQKDLTQRLELVRRAVDDQISYQQQVIMKGVVQENWGKLAGNDVNSVLAYSRILRHQDVLVSLEEQKNRLDAVYKSGLVEKCIFIQADPVPEEPVRPRAGLNTMVAGLLALMVSVFGVFFYEYMKDDMKAS